ncbi:hypothetical protein Q8A67_009656 [Cirrhinus molitorella]|uniref:Uncharacterized protein n=1 Tax=Cirrhinus molitorella TaxID=172907 RepID=A0AA88PRF7_9TELE|nr:hypothetical protein Q8A67_009656 [Cirrhinus molitorella]
MSKSHHIMTAIPEFSNDQIFMSGFAHIMPAQVVHSKPEPSHVMLSTLTEMAAMPVIVPVMATTSKSLAKVAPTPWPRLKGLIASVKDPPLMSVRSAVVPVPNITVFRQMEDREHVMVMCSFGKRLNESTFHLLLEGEHNYTQNNPLCYSSEKCVFEVKDSPPVSLICEHKIHSVESHQSETYIYSASGVAEEEGISLFYICFSSFIAVGLLIMIAAVVVTTIMSKTKSCPSAQYYSVQADGGQRACDCHVFIWKEALCEHFPPVPGG